MTCKTNGLNHTIPPISLAADARQQANSSTAYLFAQGIISQPIVVPEETKYFQMQAERYVLEAEKIDKDIETIKNFLTALKNPTIPEKILKEQFFKMAPRELKKIIEDCLEIAFPNNGSRILFFHSPQFLLLMKNFKGETPFEFYIAQQQDRLNGIQEIAGLYSQLASNKISSSEEKIILKKINVLKSSRPPAKFILNYVLRVGIHPNDTLQTAQEISKLHQLQDFYVFLTSSDHPKEFIYEKFQGLDHEIKTALGNAIWVACYKPDELFFADHFLAGNPYVLLDCKDAQGTDVIIQMMNHYKAKIDLQRFTPQFAIFAKNIIAANDREEQRRLFHNLSKSAQADLAHLAGIDGMQKIENNPSILFSAAHSPNSQLTILETYTEILEKKIEFNFLIGIEKFAKEKEKTLPSEPIYSPQFVSEPPQAILPHVRVAMVSAEFAGVISSGGLAPAVAGIARGCGTDDVCVILPKYDVINPKLILQEKEKYTVELNGELHKIFKCKVDGMTCYLIEDDLFKVGYDKDGKPNKFYEGWSDLEVQRRWAHFQSLAADLVYTLSKKEKNPVQLVHIHDAQTALIPKILMNRHYDEWKAGETPAVVFTFHNNNCPLAFKDDHASLNLLKEIHLPFAPINSFIEGLEASDMNTTVSKNFAKEVQTPLFGKGMQRQTKINALKGKLTGIVNGNTEGWNPKTDPQLKHWISWTGYEVDLSYSPADHDLPEKMIRIRKELVDYLATYHLGDFDVTKPIFLYVGRYDASQKGIDKLPIIMEEVLNNGGQFICIGTEPDAKADAILNQMEEFARRRSNKGVSIIRDFKRPDGRLFWQHGNANSEDRSGVEGCGSLLRAATDVGVFPSMFEPCGLVQGEMHRMGVETMATATGGFVDTIFTSGKNRNGYLFPRLPTWESIEQDEVIRESIRGALQRNQDKLNALYTQDLDKLEPYLTQKRIMMTNAAKSTWTSTFDGSLSPIERYQLVYLKAFENQQKRGLIHLDLHALGNSSYSL